MASELDAFLNKELSSDKRKESKTAQDSGAQGMSLLDVLKTQPEAKFGRGAGIGASRFVENLPFVGEKIATSIPFIKQLAKQEPEDAIGEIGRFAGEEAPAFALANPIVRAAGKLIPTAARLAPRIEAGIEGLPSSIKRAQDVLAETLKPAATRIERLLGRAGTGAGVGGTAAALQSGDEGRADIGDVLGSFAGGAALGTAGNLLAGIPGEIAAKRLTRAKPYEITQAVKNLRNVAEGKSSELYDQSLKSYLSGEDAEIPFIPDELRPYLSKTSPVKIVHNKLMRKEKDIAKALKENEPGMPGTTTEEPEEAPTSFKHLKFGDLHELLAAINKETATANRALLKGPGSKFEETTYKLDQLKNYANKLRDIRSNALQSDTEPVSQYNLAKDIYKTYVAELPELSSESMTPEKYSNILSGLSRLEDAPSVQQALRIGLAKANLLSKGYLKSKLFPKQLSGDEARIVKGLFKNR